MLLKEVPAWLKEVLAWPADPLDPWPDPSEDLVPRAAWLWRQGNVLDAEATLLANPLAIASEPGSFLWAWLLLARNAYQSAQPLIQRHVDAFPGSPLSRCLQAQWHLQLGEIGLLQAHPPSFWRHGGACPLLTITEIAFLLSSGDLPQARLLLGDAQLATSLEGVRLQASLHELTGNRAAAIALLEPAVEKAPGNAGLHGHLLRLLFEAQDGQRCMPALRSAFACLGERPELLTYATWANLLRRRPALTRRSALMQRLGSPGEQNTSCVANLLCSFEHLGLADWLPYIHQSCLQPIHANLPIQANLLLQLASLQDPLTPKLSLAMVASMQALMPTDLPPLSSPPQRSRPRIAWITGDFRYHPVGRFLLGYLQASKDCLALDHTVVSLAKSEELFRHSLSALPGVDFLDLDRQDSLRQTHAIRDLQADIAVDLNGWTAGHLMNGFLAGLAPIQVNYLGYFASTGLPTMDYWMGDRQLFPELGDEWHTESIWRLPRPFLAWQPAPGLPEAHAPVLEPPTGAIRFGSFNHFRKISDSSLKLWAELLQRLPDAQLLIKGPGAEDHTTLALLRRRMHRAGVPLERIELLPFAEKAEDHLAQYGRVDLALDPLPNNGCTTTCEALWMGVPTLTITGSHYVSRMSTAVLQAAGLPEWVCSDRHMFLQRAVNCADDLATFRQQRGRWRPQLQASELGDAKGLMAALEQAFIAMHQQRSTTPSGRQPAFNRDAAIVL